LNFFDKRSKQTHIKFHEIASSGSRVILCGQTDMTILVIAFRNLGDAPKNIRCVDEF